MRAGLIVATLLAATTHGGPAAASQAPGAWYMGDWQCTLDGRPTRMSWRIVEGALSLRLQ